MTQVFLCHLVYLHVALNGSGKLPAADYKPAAFAQSQIHRSVATSEVRLAAAQVAQGSRHIESRGLCSVKRPHMGGWTPPTSRRSTLRRRSAARQLARILFLDLGSGQSQKNLDTATGREHHPFLRPLALHMHLYLQSRHLGQLDKLWPSGRSWQPLPC